MTSQEPSQSPESKPPVETNQELQADQDENAETAGEATPLASNTTTVQRLSWEGPLPPPSILRDFGEIDPAFPREIVDSFLAEQKHRHELERQYVKNETTLTKEETASSCRGQWMVFGIAIGLFLLTAFAIHSKLEITAAIAALATALPLIAAAVWGSRNK